MPTVPHAGVACVALLSPNDDGAFDAAEAGFILNALLGQDRWMMLSDWLFATATRADTLPVLTPAAQAKALIGKPASRLLFSHWPSRAEVGGWRMIAASIYPWAKPLGSFPWEVACSARPQ